MDPISLSSVSDSDVKTSFSDSNPSDVRSGSHVYITNPRVAELPEKGWVTFYYVRGPLTLKEGEDDGDSTASAELTLTEITKVKRDTSTENENAPADASNMIDDIFKSL